MLNTCSGAEEVQEERLCLLVGSRAKRDVIVDLPIPILRKSDRAASPVLDTVEARMSAAQARFSSPSDYQELYIPRMSASGFSIRLYADSIGIHGWFGGLNQAFDSLHEAMTLVRIGLSSRNHLHTVRVGSRAVEWILESKMDGRAFAASRRGSVLRRFISEEHVYQSNDLLE